MCRKGDIFIQTYKNNFLPFFFSSFLNLNLYYIELYATEKIKIRNKDFNSRLEKSYKEMILI